MRNILAKIDYRISSNAYSRPQYQVKLIVDYLKKKLKKSKNFHILDIGGGTGQYKYLLQTLSSKYNNLEIKYGTNVDIIGSIYKIPCKSNTYDLVTLFMVLEHLENPIKGLKESNRVLKKGGYLALTTVQYWQTHNYPGDYYRFTKQGLIYLCAINGFKIEKIWSHGGPVLVVFHAVEINLSGIYRNLFSVLFFKIADILDWILFKHYDTRTNSDSVGWSLIAKKT